MSNITRRKIMQLGAAAIMGIRSREMPAVSNSSQSPQTEVLVPPSGSTDPLVHSIAENIFWSQIMAEHAGFFITLMPGDRLAPQRAEAERFQRLFRAQLDRARGARLDADTYGAFNRSTAELIKPFIEYKQRLADAQRSGTIRTLVWPSFLDHTIWEAERASERLHKLAAGTATLEYSEVVDFWSEIMSDHAQFIAHLLDPGEDDLVNRALDASAVFKGFNLGNQTNGVLGRDILMALEELIDFKSALERGIETAGIRSIIEPTLAAHMRREALKFADELKRTRST